MAYGTPEWKGIDRRRLLSTIVHDLHAVRFVLQVWSPSNDWQLVASSVLEQGGRARAEVRELALAFAPFNVAIALGVWDDSHRAAFMDWVETPFFLAIRDP